MKMILSETLEKSSLIGLGTSAKLGKNEIYLAHYCQVGVHMSMDAITTSPVGSTNNLVKHGNKDITSNTNLSYAVRMATSAIDDRFDDHNKQAVWEMGIINRASQDPTKRDIERKA